MHLGKCKLAFSGPHITQGKRNISTKCLQRNAIMNLKCLSHFDHTIVIRNSSPYPPPLYQPFFSKQT